MDPISNGARLHEVFFDHSAVVAVALSGEVGIREPHPFGVLLKTLRERKPGLSQTRLAELTGYAPAILVRMCQGKKDLTGPSGRERILRIVTTLCDAGVSVSVAETDLLLSNAGFPPLFDGQPLEAALRRRLQASEQSKPATRGNLPVAATTLVGRDHDIRSIVKKFEHARLITITGTGGIGKTRLALETARHLSQTQPDGCWWVDLVPVSDPQLVPQTIARMFGLIESAGMETLEALQRYLRSKHLLLVLDNCEHMLDVCAQVIVSITAACPHVRLLVTSREVLRVPGEMVWEVAPFSTPRSIDLRTNAIQHYDSVRFFVDRASAVRQDFALDEHSCRSVAQICRHVDGIPLALELAAGLVAGMTVQDIAAQMKSHLPLPASGQRASPHHETMRDALMWSFDLLSKPQQRLLLNVSIFVVGFTCEAAAAVHGTSASEAQSLLLDLVRKSLVFFAAESGDTRYRLLEPIRQFLADIVERDGGQAQLKDRHLAHFVRFANHADAGFMQNDCATWARRVAADYENLRAARDWCRHSSQTSGLELELSGALWRYWIYSAQLREGQAWLRAALAHAPGGSTGNRARALYGLAWLLRYLRDYEDMTRFATESAALCQSRGDRHGAAICRLLLSVQAQCGFDHERAQILRNSSLQTLQELGDDFSAINTMFEEAWARLDAGEYAIASAQLAHCKTLSLSVQDLNSVWTNLWWLAYIELGTGSSDSAHLHLNESIAVAHTCGITNFMARSIELLARCDPGQALALGQGELNALRTVGDEVGVSNLLLALGRIQLDLGHLEAARSMLVECAALWSRLGYAENEWGGPGWACLELGHLQLQKGNPSDALVHYDESLRLHTRAKAPDGMALARYHRARLAARQGLAAQATRWFAESLQQFRALGLRWGIALSLGGLYDTAMQRGDAHTAAHFAGSACAMLRLEELAMLRKVDRHGFEHMMADAQLHMAGAQYSSAFREGNALSIPAACERARQWSATANLHPARP